MIFIPLQFADQLAGGLRDPRAARSRPLTAERRASTAERERDAAARIAVAEERARIARELHDIVAHAVSVMVLQVGAVRHKLPDDLAEDREALRSASSRPAARRSARCAVCSMAMRREGDEVELVPQPGLESLDAAAGEGRPRRAAGAAARRGRPVPRSARDRPLGLPDRPGGADERAQARPGDAAPTSRSATSRRSCASRYATTASAPTSTDGLGHGLVGVRERVKIYGGEMTRGEGERQRLRPQHAAAVRRARGDDDPRPRRRRPVDGAGRASECCSRANRTSRSWPRRATASRRWTRLRASSPTWS